MALTAFGALMVATNVFNNALRVPLDEYLEPYPARSRRQRPMGEFSGKVAFITGAAHGQGRATALALAREGAAIAGASTSRGRWPTPATAWARRRTWSASPPSAGPPAATA